MKKSVLFLSFSLIILASCMAESNNLSPLTKSFSSSNVSEKNIVENLENNVNKNVYASEITDLTTSFPKTSNEKFNEKISLLKFQVQYYIEINDVPSLKQKTAKNIKSTYKKVQSLMKKLSEEEKELVKIPLVKIKTNISKLQAVPTEINQQR